MPRPSGWPFFLSRKVTSSTVVNAPFLDTVSSVQHPPTLARLNPLVIDVSQHPSDATIWNIKDSIPILFGLKYELEFAAHFQLVNDVNSAGMDTFVKPGLGTAVRNQWRVTRIQGEDEMCEVREDAEVSAFCLLLPFITGTLGKSRQKLLAALADRVERGQRSARTSASIDSLEKPAA